MTHQPGSPPPLEEMTSGDPAPVTTAIDPAGKGGSGAADAWREVHWVDDIGTILGILRDPGQAPALVIRTRSGWGIVGSVGQGVEAHHAWLIREGYAHGIWRPGDTLPEYK